MIQFLRQLIRPVLEELVAEIIADTVNTQFPAIVMAYNPTTQRADLQPCIQRRITTEDGEPAYERVGVIANVPVQWEGTGTFGSVMDISIGDRLWVECSQENLDQWMQQDSEAPGSALPRYALKDAVASPKSPRANVPRAPVGKGQWRIGCDDGPFILFDSVNQTITFSAMGGLELDGQGSVTIHSDGAVTIQERVVDPIGGHDI